LIVIIHLITGISVINKFYKLLDLCYIIGALIAYYLFMAHLIFENTTLSIFDEEKYSIWTTYQHHINSERKPPKQLLKWIGNKQRFATTIAKVFPEQFRTYIEPFVGSGAVLGAIAPKRGVAGDVLKPLIAMWNLLKENPQLLYDHYHNKWQAYLKDPLKVYKQTLASYNEDPNPLDLVFISRTCYGGVIRFTKQGNMSTPIGPHKPIPPESFKERMILWRGRIKDTIFMSASFEETMKQAGQDDIVYCDPPYVDSQTILYGAQLFKVARLWEAIYQAKSKGAKIALSIDGHKKSGSKIVQLDIPKDLFKREVLIEGGSSMLRRLQKTGEIMIGEDVHDRLLLTW
jgi:DNA adenine methylase